MSRKAVLAILGACLTSFAIFSPQQAGASVFDVTFVGGGFNINAEVTATPDAGNYDITNITGKVQYAAGSFIITGLVTTLGTPPLTGDLVFLPGTFTYDDVIFAGPPLRFDDNGVLFTASDGICL